ncbi:MAG: AtzE family amidohydrolase [Opitutales bacterium]
MSTPYYRMQAAEIAAGVKTKQFSAVEIVQACIDRIDTVGQKLNAFTRVTRERALAEAAELDAALARGEDVGPLAGVPFAVKNLFDLKGEVTVAGSKINRDNDPAESDATAVQRLTQAGAICVGALNMGEYAYDFVTENAHDGATLNPWDLGHSAGGSSGGSGAATAGGLVPITLGTDTNGSIRVPSSFCGIWGIRPTYGRLSRGGSFAFVDSIDTIGPFARSVEDLAQAYDAMSGPDARDAACSELPETAFAQTLTSADTPFRIAKLGGYFAEGGDPKVHAAVDTVMAALGVSESVEIPEPALARTSAFVITCAEAGARHLDRVRSRAHDFDPNIRDRFIAGTMVPHAWVDKAQRFRTWWHGEVMKVFESVDILIAPATPLTASKLGQKTLSFNGEQLPLRPNIGLFTQPLSFAGLPILAAPVHRDEQMPCAVQLVAAPHAEEKLFKLARKLETMGVCTSPVASF